MPGNIIQHMQQVGNCCDASRKDMHDAIDEHHADIGKHVELTDTRPPAEKQRNK